MGKKPRLELGVGGKVTTHSKIAVAQLGPTVTRVSNLQYESKEKSRDRRELIDVDVKWKGGGSKHERLQTSQ